MATLVHKNNVKSTTTNDPLFIVDTVVNVVDGSDFPASGDFMVTIWDKISYPDPSDDPNMEICRATSRTANAITVTRGQENTSIVVHPIGSAIEMLITAGVFNEALSTYSYVSKSDNYTLTDSDKIVEMTVSGKTITLPTAIGVSGKEYTIDNSSGGDITVDTVLSQTIEGESSQTVPTDSSMVVYSNGSNWRIN